MSFGADVSVIISEGNQTFEVILIGRNVTKLLIQLKC